MKIIFSRKGFDSGSGGAPSPIFPDGKILSLPIPDKYSPIEYQDINCNGLNLGEIVSALTKDKIPPSHKAHLDPDLIHSCLSRHQEWRPLLGQVKAAQGHLRKQNITSGDIFLFFGLFREIESTISGMRFKQNSTPKHLLWGWLQIDEIIAVDSCNSNELKWARYHPHFHREKDHTNTVYIAKKNLDIPGIEKNKYKGAGVFQRISEELQLTAQESKKPSLWEFPNEEHCNI